MTEETWAVLYFDGWCKGNGTPQARGAYGWVLLGGGDEILASGSGVLDPAVKTTINTVAYAGLIVALRTVLRNHPNVTSLEARSDCRFVVNQVCTELPDWRTTLAVWYREAKQLVRRLEKRGCSVRFRWIRAKDNPLKVSAEEVSGGDTEGSDHLSELQTTVDLDRSRVPPRPALARPPSSPVSKDSSNTEP
jgi:ribonuclease HI